MIGTYRFIQDGKVIAESSNLITTAGKKALLDYAARFTKQLVGSLVVGIGNTAASVGNVALGFEVARASVQTNSVDYPNNAVIFKAQIPQEVAMTIYEVGAHTQDATVVNDFGSALLLDFNSLYDTWSSGTYVATNSRLGSALQVSAGASTTVDSNQNVFMDLSGYSAADTFTFAYRANTANTSFVALLFRTDASNYYSYAFAPANGVYNITSFLKGAATATGSPDWSNITQITMRVAATAGGTATVDFDGLRIDDTDAYREESVLFSRSVLGAPVVKTADLPLDIEYAVTF